MPSPADLVLRDAVLSDIQPIAQLVAGGPDAAADWTYPDWRSKAAEMERLYVRVFGSLLAARRNLVRVAERGGRVVGYCAWVKREKEGDEVVTADLTEGWDEKELEAEVARLIGTDPVPKFASVLTGVPARLAAIKSLRDGQAPEPCLAVASGSASADGSSGRAWSAPRPRVCPCS
ncbi:hypothetical protein PWT90_08039 [Aphanocladium album]|nr:hypothetical protein PWT90_08039 [Aphanocladium album]